MALPGEELHDIADPRPLLPGIQVPLWFWITLAAVACAALTVLVFFFLRRNRNAAPAEVSFYRESNRALLQLRESLPGRSLAEIATEASLIMRHYLALTLDEPALYETHEEFITRNDALAQLPAGARERLTPLLNQLSEAKYGPSAPHAEAATKLVDSCLEVLAGLDSTRERQVA